MSLQNLGIEGEKKARLFFKQHLKLNDIFQADWILLYKDKYFITEIKNKSIYVNPFSYGLNQHQVKSRMNSYYKTGIRCLFFCICNEHKCYYYQWLDRAQVYLV